MIWSWILARPAWIVSAALVVALGLSVMNSERHKGNTAEALADTAKAQAAFANLVRANVEASLAMAQKARAEEQRQREAVEAVELAKQEEIERVQQDATRIVDGLRDGTIRMRSQWAGCETLRLSEGTGTAAVVADQDRLRRESVRRILGWVGELQAERNACVDGWSAVAKGSAIK